MSSKCPNCAAPLRFYHNSDGSSTEYCDYCKYRVDHKAPPETTASKVTNMVGNFVGEVFGTNILPEKKLSDLEIVDREKRIADMKARMTDKERKRFEKESRKKVFDPKTGTYRQARFNPDTGNFE